MTTQQLSHITRVCTISDTECMHKCYGGPCKLDKPGQHPDEREDAVLRKAAAKAGKVVRTGKLDEVEAAVQRIVALIPYGLHHVNIEAAIRAGLRHELGRVPAQQDTILRERCAYHVCDEAEEHDPNCKDWSAQQVEVPAVELVTDEEAMKAVLNFYRTEEGSTSGLLAVDTDSMKLALESFLQSRAAKGVKL